MENQDNNYNNDFGSEAPSNEVVEEMIKKKKARILIIVELVLFILVLFLAVIFFTNKGGGINIFSRSGEEPGVNNIFVPGNNQLSEDDENKVNNQGDINFPVVNNPDISIPVGNNLQVIESVRLSLPVPEQSPVSTEEEIPAGAVKISGLETGFSPAEFRVSSGEEVTLALTSRIDFPVILTFYDENMPAISIGCGPRETRWVTFVAPQTKGRYLFRNDVFGRSEQTGVMIVE